MEKTFYQNNPYLDHWKKELDDESINRHVLNTLLSRCGSLDRILDLGTGSGVQIRRNIELGLLKNNGTIIGIDINKDALVNSLYSFKEWAKENKYSIKIIEDPIAIHKFILTKDTMCYSIVLYDESVYSLGTKESKIKETFPLVTALSLIEHTDIERSLQSIKRAMQKGGLLYLPVNYDQHSVFGPTSHDMYKSESDLMQLFNYSGIDFQFKGEVDVGNSHCGSLLPRFCSKNDFKVIDYGSSDWIIASGDVVPYSTNKKKVLKFFIDSFYDVLKNSSKEVKKMFNVTGKQIDRWYSLRKKQLKSGELYYSCVQKDILCVRS
jgi:SAM-dependent methyltransferase